MNTRLAIALCLLSTSPSTVSDADALAPEHTSASLELTPAPMAPPVPMLELSEPCTAPTYYGEPRVEPEPRVSERERDVPSIPQSAMEPDKPSCLRVTRTSSGMRWEYDNGLTIVEPYLDYTKRTGKAPFVCTSGYCGTAGPAGTPAVGGCRCGCRAAACSCAHSPAIGRTISTISSVLPQNELHPIAQRPESACASGQCSTGRTWRLLPRRRR